MHIHMHPCKFYMARYGFIMFFKVLYSVSMGASHSFYRLCSSMFTPPARSVLRWKIPQECGCQATPTLTVYSCGLPLLFCHSASKHQAFIISLNHVEWWYHIICQRNLSEGFGAQRQYCKSQLSIVPLLFLLFLPQHAVWSLHLATSSCGRGSSWETTVAERGHHQHCGWWIKASRRSPKDWTSRYTMAYMLIV